MPLLIAAVRSGEAIIALVLITVVLFLGLLRSERSIFPIGPLVCLVNAADLAVLRPDLLMIEFGLVMAEILAEILDSIWVFSRAENYILLMSSPKCSYSLFTLSSLGPIFSMGIYFLSSKI